MVDFVRAMCVAHRRPSPYPTHCGEYDMAKLWGITSTEFWKPAGQHSFWLNAPRTHQADAILSAVCQRVGTKNVWFATSPSLADASYSGKIAWVKRWYPEFKRRTIPIVDKWLLAKRDRILVDDTPKNIYAWVSEGGLGVWCPSEWNTAPGDVLARIATITH